MDLLPILPRNFPNDSPGDKARYEATKIAANFTRLESVVTDLQQAGSPYDVSADAYGAVGDGVTDDTAAIQAAINYVSARGGGRVLLGPSTYLVGALSVTSPNVMLVGTGGGNVFAAYTTGCRLLAKSGTTNLLTFETLIASAQPISGSGIDGILLDGGGIAAIGLVVRSCTGCRFANFRIQGCTGKGLSTEYGSGPSAGLKQVYACVFDNWSIHATNTCRGMQLAGEAGGAGGNRTTFCTFSNGHIYHEDAAGIYIPDADTNWFTNIGISRQVSDTGFGIDLVGDSGVSQDLCENNQFHAVHAGFGGWRARGAQCRSNYVFGLSTTDGVPVSIITGAQLFFIKDINTGPGWGSPVKTWDFAVDGAVNHVDALDLSAYSEIMIIIDAVTMAASGYRWIKVGSTAGASWEEGGTEFYLLDSNGVISSGGHYIQAHFTASGSARYATVVISNFNVLAHKKAQLGDRQWYGAITTALDSIQIFGVAADFTTPTNFSGGTITVFGRP